VSAPPPPAPERLEALLSALAGLRAWVVGDPMLDEYLLGQADRIAPEAPVPVVRARERRVAPGGAANVAAQIAALGAQVDLCGAIGDDGAGDELLALCAGTGVGTAAVVRVPGRITVRKLRVVAAGRPLARVDFEPRDPVAEGTALGALARLAAAPRPDVVVLSDYAKGFLSPAAIARALALGREAGAPCAVDPKGAGWSRYRGATVVKPNLAELEAATGVPLIAGDDASLARAARAALAETGARALVVTAGARGMALVEAGGTPAWIAGSAREVLDPTGAGDAVLAALALGLGAGADPWTAAHLGAATAEALLRGADRAPVRPHEIVAAAPGRGAEKRLAPAALGAAAERWRRLGKRIVFTNGCFDLLHAGHVALLRAAAAHGDVLVVGLNSDASVRRLKGEGRPVVPVEERADLLAALACVDAVAVFEEDTPLGLVERLRPDVLVKGGDWPLEQIVGRAEVEGWGGRVVLVPREAGPSTSEILRRLSERPRS